MSEVWSIAPTMNDGGSWGVSKAHNIVGRTVRDAVISLLRSLGVTTIFGNPGSTELPFFRNFPQDFRYVLGLQESIVIGMADGYAQATRKAGFVSVHSAVGLGHALGNIFTAYRNQTPLVIVAGQQARSLLAYEPFLFAERATEFPRPYVKWTCEPARAVDVPAAIERAYHIAMQPPCGPVFVSVPVDDWDRACELPASRRVGTVQLGDQGLLREAAAALAGARNPALVVGAGVARDDAWDETILLAERHRAKVWVSPMSGRNGFPEDHQLFVGFLPARREEIVSALADSDLIVVLGGPLSLYHIEGDGPHVPEGAQVYYLLDNLNLATSAPVGTAIITHLKPGIAALLTGPEPRQRGTPSPKQAAKQLDSLILSDAYLLQQIAALRPTGAVVVEEAPSSRRAMHEYLPIIERNGFYTCASGGLGYGLPASIGVALGNPSKKIIAVLGDGSAMYAIQGLWSAAQLGLPVSFIIIKNGRYEALLQLGRHMGMEHIIGTDLPNIDFCAIARSQGLTAQSVGTTGELDAVLRESFAATHATLVEVTVD
jgi:benzoylformate decarboxylase